MANLKHYDKLKKELQKKGKKLYFSIFSIVFFFLLFEQKTLYFFLDWTMEVT